MEKIIVYILFFAFLISNEAAFSQTAEEIQLDYDQFLDLEFSEPDKAYSFLINGLNNAKSIHNNELIGYGFKYLSWYYEDMEDLNTSLSYIDSSIIYNKLLSDPTELANGYNQKGNLLSDMAFLDSSLIFYEEALTIFKKQSDFEGIAKVTNNIGLAYTDKGDYLKAIDYYHQSIEQSEAINDLESLGDVYNNLGTLFTQIEDYEQALAYHEKAYEIRIKGDDPMRLSSVVLNMGRIYLTQDQLKKSRNYFFQSLAIDQEMDDLNGVALNFNNIGLSYFKEGILDSALFYYKASLELRIELDDPFGMALSYINLGEYYSTVGDINKSIENCNRSYEITYEKNIPYERLSACNCLYEAYEKQGNITKAYKYLKESVELEELLNSESNTKELTKNEMQFVFHYKELEDSLKQAEILAQKEFEIKSTQLEKDKLSAEKRSQMWLFSVIGFFLVVIGGIIYQQLRRQKKQNQIIREKNEYIKHQKEEIDQSIAYAQKIQDTALPSKNLENLFDDSLLIYLPRDVVSGDFYWLEGNDRYSYFAVADCTGHGIPGAFISMIGTILLNEIYNSKQLTKPGDILDELNRLIQLTLMSRTGHQMKDGMDISFCRFDKETNLLEFAGANNPVWIISKATQLEIDGKMAAPDMSSSSNLFEIKADKQPIGKYADENRSFQTHTVQLNKGDQIYLFSDGYADQFGGENGKKFKYKPFKSLLIETSGLSGEIQKERIIASFTNWKGDYEQVDDICIIGVKA
ncbi:MAG: tetratricopeptide repeat protein [Crocinitomicaceae bacterium]|nr:tetratricopeptide repeat protein [Crocinitomicaceae bacterium]